jgi:uncharacterized protein
VPVVAEVRRYPVKSCRGEDLSVATVEPWGLAGDRRFMLVDGDGAVVTAREHPRLVLVTPQLTAVGLRLSSPDQDDVAVSVPNGDGPVPVDLWGSKVDAVPVDPAANAWFSQLLGRSVRLVYLHDPTQRRPNAAYSAPGDLVSLADGYPLHLSSAESLAALNALMPRPLPMTRFRPNVVVSGADAWTEDRWRLLRIGTVTFRVAKSKDRCVFTTIDPDTAVGGREPIATLARHRRWDGKTWFGVNLIPAGTGTITPGDPVKILDQVDSIEPLR